MSQGIQALVEINTHRPVLVEAADDGKVYVEGIASEAGVQNLNGRIYPVAVMERAVSEAQSRIAEGAFTGELDHPEWGYRGSLARTAIRFTDLFMEGTTVKFKGIVLNTEDGKKLQALIEGGVKIGMSTRGSGSLRYEETPDGEVTYVDSDYYMYGIDAVDIPSSETGIMRLQESLETKLNEHKGFNNMATNNKEIKTLADLKESSYAHLVDEAEKAAQAEANKAIQEGETNKQEVARLTARVAELEGQLAESQNAYTAVKKAVLGEAKAEEPAADTAVLVRLDALSETVTQLNTALAESQAALAAERNRATLTRQLNETYEAEVKGKPFETIVRKRVVAESFESVDAMKAQIDYVREVAAEVRGSVAEEVKETKAKETGKGLVESGNEADEEKETLDESLQTHLRLLGDTKKGN